MMNSRMAGQTINDRILAARHSIAGQGLAKSVCKATTEEMIGPKKKHLDYLVHCTNEPNVSIPQLANLLIERSQNTNWVVVYKALITVHHMMCYGNERFTQYLASSNSTFQLSNFLDKSGVQGVMNAKTGYDMSPFIRRYSRYLNEKAMSYRTVAFDFCKIKRGKEDGVLRTMSAEKLLKTLPVLQNQLDALLEFNCFANDLTNGVINMCFMLLFRDLIRLFACYNDGIINLLEKYFDMNKKQCRDALDVYKKFLVRMDRVAEFLKVAEYVGIDKGDIPDLTKAPSSLLDALEQHLAHIEGKKVTTSSTGSSASAHQKNIKSGVSALSSTSSAFGVANGRLDALTNNGIDENIKMQVLAEEEAAMNQYKSKVQSSGPSATNGTHHHNMSSSNNTAAAINSNVSPVVNNPFLDVAPLVVQKNHQTQMDPFLAPMGQQNVQQMPIRASDDLLQLSNPFTDPFAPQTQSPQLANSQANLWITNGNGNNGVIPNAAHAMAYSPQPINAPPMNGGFVSESNFSSVFGNANSGNSSFDGLGGVLQPSSSQSGASINNSNGIGNNRNNMQATTNGSGNASGGGALLTGDLESSLASLAENLSINRAAQPVKSVQWNSPKGGSKTSNISWTPQPMAATTGAGYKPMNQSMQPTNMQMQTATMPTMQSAMFPQMQPIMGMRTIPTNTPMFPAYNTPMPTNPMAANPMGPQQSLLFH